MAESLHSVMSPSTLTGSPIPSHSLATKEGISPPSRPFSKRFCQAGDPEVTQARAIYLKTYMTGLFTVIVTVFAVFPIYWGSLWKVPAHPLPGWIVVWCVEYCYPLFRRWLIFGIWTDRISMVATWGYLSLNSWLQLPINLWHGQYSLPADFQMAQVKLQPRWWTSKLGLQSLVSLKVLRFMHSFSITIWFYQSMEMSAIAFLAPLPPQILYITAQKQLRCTV